MLRPSSNNRLPDRGRRRGARQQGFTLVELLIGMALLMIVMLIAGAALSSSMRVKGREMQLVEVQQNLRSALQLITQDMRSGAFIHLWHSADCANDVCSNTGRVALVTTDGVMTMIPRKPGNTYSDSRQTPVCNARQFNDGDLALVFSGDKSAQLVKVTGVDISADHDQPCQNENKDMIRHAGNSISGTWSTSNYMFRAVVATYSLEPDPLDATTTVLYRRTGLDTPMAQSGVVAFNVSELDFAYGVPVDPTSAASQLIFYPTLEEAAAALGSDFVAVPGVSSKTYIGTVIQAVRVSITGQTARPIDNAGNLGEFTLTETVEFRR